MDILFGLGARRSDGFKISNLFDRKSCYRLARLGDAVGNHFGPSRLNTDHDDSGNIGIGACANDGAEMQLQICAKLKPPIGMRDCQSSLDVVGNSLTGCIRDVINRQNEHVVSDADAIVLAAPCHDFRVLEFAHLVTTALS